MEISLRKRDQKTSFKNPFEIGDNVRVEIPGLQKKSEGKYSDEIYTIIDVRGKRVVLNDNKGEPPQREKRDTVRHNYSTMAGNRK